ncbi:MAG: hypothetical protein ACTHMU_13905, partial [Thermomicrobiales bacterium]
QPSPGAAVHTPPAGCTSVVGPGPHGVGSAAEWSGSKGSVTEWASALARLLATYEPGATYEPIANGDFYGRRIARLAAVYLHVLSTDAKFKVGPAGSAAIKRQVVAGLRERNEPGDARAADEIAATLLNER